MNIPMKSLSARLYTFDQRVDCGRTLTLHQTGEPLEAFNVAILQPICVGFIDACRPQTTRPRAIFFHFFRLPRYYAIP